MFGQISEPSGFAHPYYPIGVEIPHYAANVTPVPVLLPALAGMLGSVLLATSTVALRVNSSLGKSETAVFCWFVLCKWLAPWNVGDLAAIIGNYVKYITGVSANQVWT